MIDWKENINRRSLICFDSGNKINPGEVVCSAIVYQDKSFQRLDYCETIWDEDKIDKEHFLSWWKYRLPKALKEEGSTVISSEQLLAIFTDIMDTRKRPQQCLAYCIALLLMKMKKLRIKTVLKDEKELVFTQKNTGMIYKISEPVMTEEEAMKVQEELIRLMGY